MTTEEVNNEQEQALETPVEPKETAPTETQDDAKQAKETGKKEAPAEKPAKVAAKKAPAQKVATESTKRGKTVTPKKKSAKKEASSPQATSFAIVEWHGRQYKVEEGKYFHLDLASDLSKDDTVEFDKVLMIANGDQSVVGTPYIDGAKVSATVLGERKGRKLLVYKMHRKKGYRRKQGHRQNYTTIQVSKVVGG